MPGPTDRPSRRLVSINAAADYLGVNPRTIRRLIAAGELVGYRVGAGQGRSIRVDLNQVDNEVLRPIPTAPRPPDAA